MDSSFKFSNNKRDKILCHILLVYLLALFEFSGLSIPNSFRVGDDFYYSYVCEPGADIFDMNGSEKCEMTDIVELIPSQIEHYISYNGRFVVHLLVQLYVNFLGYKALTITKILLAFGVYLMLCRIAIPKVAYSAFSCLLMLAIMLFVLPFFSIGSFFGTCALTFNYALPALGMLFVIFIFEKYRTKHTLMPITLLVMYVLLALLAGSMHEGFSTPVSFAFFVILVVRWRRVSVNAKVIVLAWWIGNLILIAAPGNYHRVTSYMTPWEYVTSAVLGLISSYYIFIPTFITAAFAWLLIKKDRIHDKIKEILKSDMLYYFVIIANFIICLMANPYMRENTRCFMPIGFMLMIICTQLCIAAFKPSVTKFVALVAFVICFGAYYSVNGIIRSDALNSRISQYREDPCGYVRVEDHLNYIPPMPFLGFDVEAEFNPMALSTDISWRERSMQEYYSRSKKGLKYVPYFSDATFSSDNLVFEQGDFKLYTQPDSWWIVATGFDDGDAEAYITRYSYKPHAFLTELFYTVFHKYPIRCSHFVDRYKGESVLVIPKSNTVDIREIKIGDKNIVF